jgi:hypothetical protein
MASRCSRSSERVRGGNDSTARAALTRLRHAFRAPTPYARSRLRIGTTFSGFLASLSRAIGRLCGFTPSSAFSTVRIAAFMPSPPYRGGSCNGKAWRRKMAFRLSRESFARGVSSPLSSLVEG